MPHKGEMVKSYELTYVREMHFKWKRNCSRRIDSFVLQQVESSEKYPSFGY